MSEDKNKNQIANSLRVVSIVFMAICAIGISMILGDVTEIYELSISSQAITTTIFGAIGFAICEINARRAEKWG